MYLDPSYQGILTSDAIEEAKSHLAKTWYILKSLQSNEQPSTSTAEILDDISVESQSDPLETFLRHHSDPLNVSNESTSDKCIETILQNYDHVAQVSYKTDIMQYWIDDKKKLPELYELAKIVHAVPRLR